MKRTSVFLLAALSSAPAFAAPIEAARVEVLPVLAGPSAAAGAIPSASVLNTTSVSALVAGAPSLSAPAAAVAVQPTVAFTPAAAPTPAQILPFPSARTTAGVAARVAQAAQSWGAPIERIFEAHDVLVYGENHGSLESVETLTREMPRLAKAGVKAIGIEGLKRPNQHAVDAYLSGRSAAVPFAALNFSPRRIKAFAALLCAAREHGVRVVALGLPLEYWAKTAANLAAANTGLSPADFPATTDAQFQRAQSGYEPGFNEAVAQVYLTDRNRTMADLLAKEMGSGGKAVVLVGQAHVDGLDFVPGRLMNAPGDWGTLADELTKRALRAFSLTQTGGKFVDEDDLESDRRSRPQSYHAADSAAPQGGAAFIPLGSDRGLWHAGSFDHSTLP